MNFGFSTMKLSSISSENVVTSIVVGQVVKMPPRPNGKCVGTSLRAANVFDILVHHKFSLE